MAAWPTELAQQQLQKLTGAGTPDELEEETRGAQSSVDLSVMNQDAGISKCRHGGPQDETSQESQQCSGAQSEHFRAAEAEETFDSRHQNITSAGPDSEDVESMCQNDSLVGGSSRLALRLVEPQLVTQIAEENDEEPVQCDVLDELDPLLVKLIAQVEAEDRPTQPLGRRLSSDTADELLWLAFESDHTPDVPGNDGSDVPRGAQGGAVEEALLQAKQGANDAGMETMSPNLSGDELKTECRADNAGPSSSIDNEMSTWHERCGFAAETSSFPPLREHYYESETTDANGEKARTEGDVERTSWSLSNQVELADTNANASAGALFSLPHGSCFEASGHVADSDNDCSVGFGVLDLHRNFAVPTQSEDGKLPSDFLCDAHQFEVFNGNETNDCSFDLVGGSSLQSAAAFFGIGGGEATLSSDNSARFSGFAGGERFAIPVEVSTSPYVSRSDRGASSASWLGGTSTFLFSDGSLVTHARRDVDTAAVGLSLEGGLSAVRGAPESRPQRSAVPSRATSQPYTSQSIPYQVQMCQRLSTPRLSQGFTSSQTSQFQTGLRRKASLSHDSHKLRQSNGGFSVELTPSSTPRCPVRNRLSIDECAPRSSTIVDSLGPTAKNGSTEMVKTLYGSIDAASTSRAPQFRRSLSANHRKCSILMSLDPFESITHHGGSVECTKMSMAEASTAVGDRSMIDLSRSLTTNLGEASLNWSEGKRCSVATHSQSRFASSDRERSRSESRKLPTALVPRHPLTPMQKCNMTILKMEPSLPSFWRRCLDPGWTMRVTMKNFVNAVKRLDLRECPFSPHDVALSLCGGKSYIGFTDFDWTSAQLLKRFCQALKRKYGSVASAATTLNLDKGRSLLRVDFMTTLRDNQLATRGDAEELFMVLSDYSSHHRPRVTNREFRWLEVVASAIIETSTDGRIAPGASVAAECNYDPDYGWETWTPVACARDKDTSIEAHERLYEQGLEAHRRKEALEGELFASASSRLPEHAIREICERMHAEHEARQDRIFQKRVDLQISSRQLSAGPSNSDPEVFQRLTSPRTLKSPKTKPDRGGITRNTIKQNDNCNCEGTEHAKAKLIERAYERADMLFQDAKKRQQHKKAMLEFVELKEIADLKEMQAKQHNPANFSHDVFDRNYFQVFIKRAKFEKLWEAKMDMQMRQETALVKATRDGARKKAPSDGLFTKLYMDHAIKMAKFVPAM